MKIQSTKNALAAQGINLLIYGRAGVGKTTAIAYAPKPIILSAEGGLLCLQGLDVPFIEIDSIKSLREAYTWLAESKEGKEYETFGVDSISEICDIAMREYRGSQEPAKLYPAIRSQVLGILQKFRDLPSHVVMTAREQTKENRKKEMITQPAVSGSRLSEDLSHVFDIVLHLTFDESGRRVAYTDGSNGSVAKDRTGRLPVSFENCDKIFQQIFKCISKEVKK